MGEEFWGLMIFVIARIKFVVVNNSNDNDNVVICYILYIIYYIGIYREIGAPGKDFLKLHRL